MSIVNSMNTSRDPFCSMSPPRFPTLRDLHAAPTRRTPSRRAHRDAWIDEDPDLAPPPRSETPLTAWA